MIPDPPPPFDLSISESVRERIFELTRQAAIAGIGVEFVATVSYILDQLRERPRDWGEPFKNLRGFQMTARMAIHQRLRVIFSVHDRIPLVVLWSLSPTTGHPLAPPENGN